MSEIDAFYPNGDARPLLFFKVGVLGFAPLEFPRLLAEDLDAEFFSSDKERLRILAERGSELSGRQLRVNQRNIRERFASFATAQLTEGRDVVSDVFFNSAESRKLPVEIAHKTGALSIALYPQTGIRFAQRRVSEWSRTDGFEVPVRMWHLSPVRVMRAMYESLEAPDLAGDEGIDVVMQLGGTGSAKTLVETVGQRLEDLGLIEAGPAS